MVKSSQFKYQWFIPSVELDSEKPTAFLIRQMSKRQYDAMKDRETRSERIGAIWSYMEGSTEVADDVKKAIAESRITQGFDEALYKDCVKEVRNIEVEGEYKESITDRSEIIKAIAGIEDQEVSEELDDAIKRLSTLEEFEVVNFTPSAGKYPVLRTAIVRQAKDLRTALSAPMVSQERSLQSETSEKVELVSSSPQ